MSGITGMYPNATLPRAAGAAVDMLGDTKGFKDGVKVGAYALKWAKIHEGSLTPAGAQTLKSLESAKNLVGVVEFFEHLKKFAEYSFRWITGSAQTPDEAKAKITQGTRPIEMGFEVVEMVNPFKDGVSFGKDHSLIALNAMQQTALDAVGSAALIVGPGRGAYKAMNEIIAANKDAVDPTKTIEQHTIAEAKAIKSWLSLIKLTSYVALGCILGTALLTGMVLQPWVPLACVTNALIFGLAGNFHTKLSVLTPQRV